MFKNINSSALRFILFLKNDFFGAALPSELFTHPEPTLLTAALEVLARAKLVFRRGSSLVFCRLLIGRNKERLF